jgi:hypothetical protein
VELGGEEKEMTLRAAAPQFPEVDIWGARKRSKLFEKVFDTSLRIEWADNSQKHDRAAGQTDNGAPTGSHESRPAEKAL